MNRWKTPLLINGTIALVLICIDLLTASPHGGEFTPRFAMSGTLILLLAPVNLIVGMVRNRKRTGDGPVYIALSGILLLIGFSVCTIQ